MAVKTYSPKEVGCLFGGVDLTGWKSIKISRSDQLFKKVVSADGKEISRARNDDRSGQAEITFDQFADSNSFLDAVRKQDERHATGVATFKLANKLSGEQVFASEAWIQSVPDMEYTNEIGERVWILDLSEVDYNLTAQSNSFLSAIANVVDFFESIF